MSKKKPADDITWAYFFERERLIIDAKRAEQGLAPLTKQEENSMLWYGTLIAAGLVFVCWFVANFWQTALIIVFVCSALGTAALWVQIRRSDSRERLIAIVERAESQHLAYLDGQDEGIYGEYPPFSVWMLPPPNTE